MMWNNFAIFRKKNAIFDAINRANTRKIARVLAWIRSDVTDDKGLVSQKQSTAEPTKPSNGYISLQQDRLPHMPPC